MKAGRLFLRAIKKTDLAAAVGADLDLMEGDARLMRGTGPVIFAQVKNGPGVDAIIESIIRAWQHATSASHSH